MRATCSGCGVSLSKDNAGQHRNGDRTWPCEAFCASCCKRDVEFIGPLWRLVIGEST